MSYYRECDRCGAAIDPGEVCDCNAEQNFKLLTPEHQAIVIAKIDELVEEQKRAALVLAHQDGKAEQNDTRSASSIYEN